MAEGFHTEPLDKRTVCQKRRRTMPGSPQSLDTLPAEWRELLARWVQRGGNSRWETLRNDAGVTRVQMAQALLDWLLRSGWAAVIEQRKLNEWWPQHIELLNLSQLRSALGLRDKDSDAQTWQAVRSELAGSLCNAFTPALLALDELPLQRALARYDLIVSLQRWQNTQQSGTRRDFALFARSDTKSVLNAEWAWLESTLDLAEFRVERHTPLLLLSAPLQLHFSHGQLDLSTCPDFAALTPGTVQNITRIEGEISHWHLVENRTSFERLARQHEAGAAVIWLPGFPPIWWCTAVARLLDLMPAPAKLSCDPDPAGIAIALQAAELWQHRKLGWQPWKMDVDDLTSLAARKSITALDRQQLERLLEERELPSSLSELARWMLDTGEKGEQEGYL